MRTQKQNNFTENYEKKFVPMRVDPEYKSKYGEIKIIISVQEMIELLDTIPTKTIGVFMAESKSGNKYFYRWASKDERVSFPAKEKEDDAELPF